MKSIKKVLIVCYYGKFPEWTDVWLRSCELNADFDFIVITDKEFVNIPRNVAIINLSMDDMRRRLSLAAGFDVVLNSPYKLCDYKPLYGKALKEFIEGYDFWGHCDIDLIWGRLSQFITNSILQKYDLIGMYGHLMLYRNTDYMNNLFKLDGGTFSYKKVFSSKYNYSFDEMSGMDLIASKNKVKHFTSIKIANASPDYERFKLTENKSMPEYFIWDKGKVLRIYGYNAEYVDEYAYIHFSGKKPKNSATQIGISQSSLYLSARGITDRTSHTPNRQELLKHNEYISDDNDIQILKKKKKEKIRKILMKNFKEKVIWYRVHRGITKYMKIKD